jgi:hypothetical protein
MVRSSAGSRGGQHNASTELYLRYAERLHALVVKGTWILSETATSDTFVLTLVSAGQVFIKGPILQLNGPNQFILALTSPGLMTFVQQH